MNPIITIDNFDGPLDLLLSLIKKNNMDIYDINLLEVIEQYINYINDMKDLNLNIASEYLVMTSELLEIKSRSLLPNHKETELEEENLEVNLINRLVEYQQYKELTSTFKQLQDKRSQIYTKSPENISNYNEEEVVNEQMDMNILMDALNKMLERLEYDKPLNTKITNKELSVKEYSDNIINKLRKVKEIEFEKLIDRVSKDIIIVNFLAILNLVRKDAIIVKQDNNFDKIIIELRNKNE